MTTHLRDSRRPEGSAVTAAGVIRQIPVICALDLLEVPEVLPPYGREATRKSGPVDVREPQSADWYTDEPELVDCDDCLARIEEALDREAAPGPEAFLDPGYGYDPEKAARLLGERVTLTHAGDRCERAIELLERAAAALHYELGHGLRDDIEAFLAEVPS